MTVAAEDRKTDLVERLAAEVRSRVPAEQRENAEQFVRRYFALVAPDDIIYTSFDTLIGGALSLWEFGAQRQPGKPKVRLFNPSVEKNGWGLEHTVLEVVNDDMPFIVDSVTAEINRRERNIHLLLHPVMRVRRDSSGRRVELAANQPAPPDAITESYMHVEIDQETEPGELELIRASIERVLESVRVAVTDWRAMRARLAENIQELETRKLPMAQEEVDEAKAFLKWLDEGNYIFLGFRRYGFETRDGKDYLPAQPQTGLGILREMRTESKERSDQPLSPEFSAYARRKDLLIITKANNRSTIHRPVPMDRVGIKRYDANGELIGEDRFLGLFTSAAYSRSVREIPMLRLKFKRTLDKAGLDPRSHNGKALVEILETFPRDEFFQITDSDLFDIARGILLLQERHRVALFTRRDVFERFVSCYVFVPRDRYTPDFKDRARQILEEAFEGRDTAIYDHVTDSPLARGLFVVRTSPGRIPEVDIKRVEAYLAEAARTWSDRLLEALIQHHGEEAGIELHRRYKKAFPMAYSERFSAEAALYDIAHVEEVLATGKLKADLYRHRGQEQRQFHFKIIHAGPPVPLSEIMPRLENMGLKVQSEVPYEVQPLGAESAVRIRDFSLSAAGMQDDLRPIKQKFQETFIRVWSREAENDGFNRLVIGAELEWHEVVVLRAYSKYIRQMGVPLSETTIQQTLAANATITRLLLQLFVNNFDPSLGAATRMSGRHAASLGIRAQIEDALNAVTNPDEDRILRLYVTLIESTLRTNYFRRSADSQSAQRSADSQSVQRSADSQSAQEPAGEPALRFKPYLSFKLDSHAIAELPAPRPMFELFVYSPQMECLHLRPGQVARGGIRWSARR